MTESNISQFSNPLFREIHKNSWLTRLPPRDSKKKKEKVWVVFCIHDDTEAYLETYSDNKKAAIHKPDYFVSLNNTQHISPTICAHELEYEFVITLSTETVRLAAPSWDIMLDWVESLRGKLFELRILSPKENVYSKLPETKAVSLLPTRDPTSPLPPPPQVPPSVPPGVETEPRNHPLLQRGLSLPDEATERSNIIGIRSADNVTIVEVNNQMQPQVFTFDLNNINETLPLESQTTYEHLFELSQSPGPSDRRGVQRSVSSPRRLQPAPQPYITLREQEVLQLQREMKHKSGVRLELRRKDCINFIGLVDAMNATWVCGWKQKEYPILYSALHIGDQIISIDGIKVQNASDAYKVLRSINSIYVNIMIKRVPHGQVFIIRREADGQSLGIIQEGTTAIIQTVQSGSLAARHGLSAKARTCDGLSFTNWVLTEINGRPLNLFFKDDEVRGRLNSVGREISILVQPLDLVKQIKRQLKTLRNYKDYVYQ